MIEELCPDLYRIEIPLPENSLTYLNAYVVRSPEKTLLIDTGMDHEECLGAIFDGLLQVGVALNKIDIFITHMHSDHFGLMPRLVTGNTKVFFNRPDAEYIASWTGIDSIIHFAKGHGFPENILREAFKGHPASKFGNRNLPPINFLSEGQKLIYGDYVFSCIETPGHTLGHTCLYEPNKKLLFAGDHLLNDITPNIQSWSNEGNPLKDYLNSLKKISHLEVNLVLPGHRHLFKEHRNRIDQLVIHHHKRLSEIIGILGAGGAMTAYEIASQMIWDIQTDSWERFPIIEKLYATGETIAHLKYLDEQGVIMKKFTVDDEYRYMKEKE